MVEMNHFCGLQITSFVLRSCRYLWSGETVSNSVIVLGFGGGPVADTLGPVADGSLV